MLECWTRCNAYQTKWQTKNIYGEYWALNAWMLNAVMLIKQSGKPRTLNVNRYAYHLKWQTNCNCNHYFLKSSLFFAIIMACGGGRGGRRRGGGGRIRPSDQDTDDTTSPIADRVALNANDVATTEATQSMSMKNPCRRNYTFSKLFCQVIRWKGYKTEMCS